MIVMIVVSLLTDPPAAEKTRGSFGTAAFSVCPPTSEHYRGWKNFVVWWFLFVAIVLSIYGFFLWFQLSR